MGESVQQTKANEEEKYVVSLVSPWWMPTDSWTEKRLVEVLTKMAKYMLAKENDTEKQEEDEGAEPVVSF